ncbi:SAM-dependent methyltransferase [Streptomyces montanisoli]|uniref:SAM-dependent methyltransferase n=1 Tax=Streptomyces montanisoli TaxID=2798581 RepID=A0A940RY85_9ACTN|nr:SAM-dependent methyltransferase [Streptomyces montanisoli]MBP0458918.1 SAM-dependent methyltransferase [Streptomyces montanisoli]
MTAFSPKPQIDTSRPHPARVYDFLLGGKDHYQVDKDMGDQLPSAVAQGARHNRAFMHRAVAWVASHGIDQYLDIGTGIPTEPNLHQIAQRAVPAARVVYADNDPIVLRHAEALLISSEQGATDYLQADVREPGVILDHARSLLDFSRPICLSLVALLHFVTDDQDPYGITRTLVDAMPSGSYLVFSHGTFDFHRPDDAYSSRIDSRWRSRAEIEPFFEGLEIVDPGLVPAPRWYKDTPAPRDEVSGIYAAVARIP